MSATVADSIRSRVILPLAYRLAGDRRFQLLNDVLSRDHWSIEQIHAHQCERLSSLLQVAHAHNPYWRQKLDYYGVDPASGDPLQELARLPVLTKDEMRTHWKQMRSTHLPDSQVIHETSSGSTGKQINFYQSRRYRELHAAMEYRSRAWMGIAPGEPYLSVQAHGAHMNARTRRLRKLRARLERGYILDAFHIDPDRIVQQLRQAARYKPVHVHGYTTSVVTVARLSIQAGLNWPTIRAVSTTSEQLFDSDRAILESAFDAPVFDRYGSREVLSVSMQCPQGNHHIYADANIIEFERLEGTDDDLHAVIATPLDNEAMPLFRYRSGDEASPVAGTCPCGRVLPLMTGCRGRICNNFVTPDGRIINGTYFLYYFYYQEGFQSYQFHQTSPEHIDLYVVPDGMLSEERRAYLEKSCRKIRDDYDSQFRVDLHIVDEIPRRKGGKHLYTISDCLSHV